MDAREPRWRVRAGVVGALLVPVLVSLSPSAWAPPGEPLGALAPVEVVAEGFTDLRGVAVDPTGHAFVADRAAGAVIRIGPLGGQHTVVAGLDRPVGLALDGAALLVAESGARRVVRIGPDGRLAPVAVGIVRPRFLALDGDGTLYVGAKALGRATRGDRDDDADDDHDAKEDPELVLSVAPGTPPRVVLDGLRHVQGLAVAERLLHAATGGLRRAPRSGDAILAMRLSAGGDAGAVVALAGGVGLRRPVGLARDRLGALFVTAEALGHGRERARRVVVKVHPDGAVTRFAAGLDDPQGLALDPDGHLWVADGRAGRALRFRAPQPPRLDPLAVATSRPAVTLAGGAEAGARILVAGADPAEPAVALADPGGRFTVAVTLAPNAVTTLSATAVGHAGAGLASPPAEIAIRHDDRPPALDVLAPAAGAFVRGVVDVALRASDDGAGLVTLQVEAAGGRLPVTPSPGLPAAAVVASVAWDTRAAADGAQPIVAVAGDGAGNVATLARTVLVDNTPPETAIASGPDGALLEPRATLVFAGEDNLTPAASLLFSWRLDGGAWSAFSAEAGVTLVDLAPGEHRVEVRARDLAGNEDPTPAERRFSVGAPGLGVRIAEPASGAHVPPGALLVRGVVTPGSAAARVLVNGLPAVVDGETFLAVVQVDATTTALTALAAAGPGESAAHGIDLVVLPDLGAAAVLEARPASGVAPLTVRFTLVGTDAVAEVALDADGDGVAEAVLPALDAYAVAYARPGVYVATASVTDAQGATRRVPALVQVLDRGALDALLQARWEGLKAALRAGDVAAGVLFIVERARDDFATAFHLLAPRLADIDTILTSIAPVELGEAAAVYEMTRTDDGVDKSFEVRFAVDWDGVWRIEAF